MEEDIRLFLNYLAKEKKCSKNTLDAYHNDLNQLADYIASTSGIDEANPADNEFSEEHLKSYMLKLREKNYALSTVARKIAAARAFLKFLSEKGKVRKDLAPKLSAPKVIKSLPHGLTVLEVQRLLAESARLPTYDAKRDRAMLELLYATGMLASELMALNVNDVSPHQGRVRVVSLKRKERSVPIDARISGLMREYIDVVRIKLLADDNETALFVNQRGERLTRQGFWQIVQGYADSAGIKAKVTPRTLRHSFAMHRLNAGADLQSIQEVLGHAHISTTRAYKQA
ncbi:MAG: tyrosine-type recombinase/integrase [Dehalococcoidia bacterium]|nr:tyrosine-type recombinase/integrase [Dehalococcoidia bacterium]MDD5494994.1 tyrosine-type recombinase/integrase [Dehalococcoidia bacterium]